MPKPNPLTRDPSLPQRPAICHTRPPQQQGLYRVTARPTFEFFDGVNQCIETGTDTFTWAFPGGGWCFWKVDEFWGEWQLAIQFSFAPPQRSITVKWSVSGWLCNNWSDSGSFGDEQPQSNYSYDVVFERPPVGRMSLFTRDSVGP